MAHIPTACQILTSYKHCRKEAAEFMACQARATQHAQSVEERCHSPKISFISCAEDSLDLVLKDLMAIAAARCRAEVGAHHRCLETKRADECEMTDTAALNCAALHVIRSSQPQPQ